MTGRRKSAPSPGPGPSCPGEDQRHRARIRRASVRMGPGRPSPWATQRAARRGPRVRSLTARAPAQFFATGQVLMPNTRYNGQKPTAAVTSRIAPTTNSATNATPEPIANAPSRAATPTTARMIRSTVLSLAFMVPPQECAGVALRL